MSKRVLITGAGSGLGQAMAQYCAARGDRVAVADIHHQRAVETLSSLKGSGHLLIELDVTQTRQWQQAVTHVQAEFGGLDLLVNNAGVASSGEFINLDDAEWDRVVAINQTAVHKGTRAMLPLLLPNPGAIVLNVASFAGIAAAPELGAYGVTKAAVVAYSEILRAQLYAKKLHVACLCPSFFKTNLLESFVPGHDRMKKSAQKLMDYAQLQAADVAKFAIERAEAGVFLLLPHRETRMPERIKRWLPNYYFKMILKRFTQF